MEEKLINEELPFVAIELFTYTYQVLKTLKFNYISLDNK